MTVAVWKEQRIGLTCQDTPHFGHCAEPAADMNMVQKGTQVSHSTNSSARVRVVARRAFTLVEIMIVILIIGILLAIAIPNYVRAREQSRAKSCSANLKHIQSAVQQYAMDNRVASGGAVNYPSDIVGDTLYIKVEPLCPSSGTYAVATVDDDPTCSATSSSYPHTVAAQ